MHVIPRAGGRDAHCDAIAAPNRCHRFYNFQQEPRAVGGVQFNPVEARGLGTRGRFQVVLDDSRNFGDIECSMWRRLDPATPSGDQVVWIFPVGCVHGG
ncbi:MAG TPA: hypothetical protein VK638_32875 [Edaphobacter sp.]|nr:hypothetical protein [Edaphobacter sp.]